MSFENLQTIRDLIEYDFFDGKENKENQFTDSWKKIFDIYPLIDKYLKLDEIIDTYWKYFSEKRRDYYHQKKHAIMYLKQIERNNDKFNATLFHVIRRFGNRHKFRTKKRKWTLRLDYENGRNAYYNLILLLELRVKEDVKNYLLEIVPQLTNLYVKDLIKIVAEYV